MNACFPHEVKPVLARKLNETSARARETEAQLQWCVVKFVNMMVWRREHASCFVLLLHQEKRETLMSDESL